MEGNTAESRNLPVQNFPRVTGLAPAIFPSGQRGVCDGLPEGSGKRRSPRPRSTDPVVCVWRVCVCVCVWRVRARLTVLVLHRYSKELEESVHAMKRAVGQEQQRADEAEEKLAAVLSSGHIPLEVPALITDLENQVCAGHECLPRGHARVR